MLLFNSIRAATIPCNRSVAIPWPNCTRITVCIRYTLYQMLSAILTHHWGIQCEQINFSVVLKCSRITPFSFDFQIGSNEHPNQHQMTRIFFHSLLHRF